MSRESATGDSGAGERAARAAARRPGAGGDPHRRRRHPGADRRAARAGGGAGAARGGCSRALSERFGLVGCVSGRQAEEARRLVGVDGIAYAGNHGLELLLPGEEEPRLDPSLDGRERGAAEFVAGLDAEELAAAGLRLEDKGPIQALHWRGAEDERAAEARAHEIAADAGRAGLEPRWGRKVLELRPVGGGGKDAAVAALLAADGVDRGRLRRRRPHRPRRLPPPARAARGRASWRRRSASASLSPEAPPELAEESDLTVDGPDGWLAILESLAE